MATASPLSPESLRCNDDRKQRDPAIGWFREITDCPIRDDVVETKSLAWSGGIPSVKPKLHQRCIVGVGQWGEIKSKVRQCRGWGEQHRGIGAHRAVDEKRDFAVLRAGGTDDRVEGQRG